MNTVHVNILRKVDCADMLKSTSHYLKKSMMFYDLRSRNLPVVIFLLLFITNVIYLLFNIDIYTFNNLSIVDIVILMGYLLTTEIISFMYQLGSIKDIRGEEYSVGQCVSELFSRIFFYLIALIAKMIIIFSGIVILIVPGVIVFLMFYFVETLVVDQKMSIVKAFKASYEVTKGKKIRLFSIEVFCMVTVFLLGSMVVMLFSSFSYYVYLYVNAFISAIMSLINTKRIAHLYTDIFCAAEEQAEALT